MKPSVPVILVLFLCLFAATGLCASTLTVTKIEDTNDGACDTDCSLREAVAAAVSGDTVVFSSLFESPQTITLTLGQIAISRNLTITGTGSNLVTISGNLAGRIFYISGNLNVTMSGMKLRDGKVGADLQEAYGGAIRVLNGHGTLDLSNMEFTNNLAFNKPNNFGVGSAVYCYDCTMTLANLNVHHHQRGAIFGDFPMSVINIRDSVLSNNRVGVTAYTLNMQNTTVTQNTAAGISAEHITLINSIIINNNGTGVIGGDGSSTMTVEKSMISGSTDGGLSNVGVANIRNSTISNNSKNGEGAGITNLNTMYLINSAITGNTASQSGGGIRSAEGQIFVTNSTISGNLAGTSQVAGGGGIFGRVDQGAQPASLSHINSTITNNQARGSGGGLGTDNQATTTVRNTVIAGNTSLNTSEADVSGAVTSQGNNLIGNTTGSNGWIASDLLNVNPLLAPLAENGGSTMTHSLLPGSPAINAGNNSVAIDPQTQMPLTTDQRGFLRFYGGTVDIGAYEEQPVITGTVIYGNAAGSPTPRFVPGVLLTAVGSPNLFVTTSAAGTYTLGGFGSGSYTVTPSKMGGVNGISSFDAGLIARHAAGITPLTGNQLIVADVSGNGTISSFDAGQIARYTAGLSGNSGTSGNWIFIPANRFYSSVNSSIAGEDFIALLMGDVSGNWQPP